MDPFPQKKEFTLNSSLSFTCLLGLSQAHILTHTKHTHTHTHTHTQSQIFLTSNLKTLLLPNLTNFKTNIRKSMHGMSCTTSKRARHTTTDKTREKMNRPLFFCVKFELTHTFTWA
jgi:hypothetical protein